MSEIQSNYPRKAQLAPLSINVPFLQRTALSGLVFAIGQTIALLIFGICIPISSQSTTLFFFIGFAALTFIGCGLGVMVCLGIWVNGAYQAVCGLRGIDSRIRSVQVALLTVFFPLLPYALDFLDVRAKSADATTMKWSSFYSKSFATNVLFLLTLAAFTLVGVTFGKSFPSEYIPIFMELFCLAYCSALFVGAFIVFRVNRNIVALIGQVQAKKPVNWDMS